MQVEVYRLERWKEKALAGLDAGLKEREGDPQSQLDAAASCIAGMAVACPRRSRNLGRCFDVPSPARTALSERALSPAQKRSYDDGDSVRVSVRFGSPHSGMCASWRVTMRKLVVAAVLSLCCLLLAPALASASTPTLSSLAKSLAALQKTVKSQGATITSLKKSLASATAKIATVQANKVLTLSWLPTYLSLDKNIENGVAAPNIVFHGANLHVHSTTSQGDSSATGNLIVGWDPLPNTPPATLRTGANNLVVGTGNNFTSFGCLLAGAQNTVSAPYASVSGGAANTAENAYSSVAGGADNTAVSYGASISGGEWITLDSVSLYAWQGGSYHTP